MTEDELVALVKQQWGIRPQPPPELAATVLLRPLMDLIATANRTVGVGTGACLWMGETGQPLLKEFDRLERRLSYTVTDLFPLPSK